MSRFAEMIKRKKITQYKLADMVGVSQPAIALLAKNGISSIKTAKRYAGALKCKAICIIENDK